MASDSESHVTITNNFPSDTTTRRSSTPRSASVAVCDGDQQKPTRRSTRTPSKRNLLPSEDVRASPAPAKRVKVSPTKSTKTKPTLKVKRKRRVKEDVFNEPDRLLGPQNSLLYHPSTDLAAILRSDAAMDFLLSSEAGYPYLGVTNTDLQYYVETFKRDGANGFHDEQWVRSAIEAGQERAAGLYDEYLEERFQEEWGGGKEYYTDSDDDGNEEGELKKDDCNPNHELVDAADDIQV